MGLAWRMPAQSQSVQPGRITTANVAFFLLLAQRADIASPNELPPFLRPTSGFVVIRIGPALGKLWNNLQVSSLEEGSFHTPLIDSEGSYNLCLSSGSGMGGSPPTNYPPVQGFDSTLIP